MFFGNEKKKRKKHYYCFAYELAFNNKLICAMHASLKHVVCQKFQYVDKKIDGRDFHLRLIVGAQVCKTLQMVCRITCVTVKIFMNSVFL